MLFLRRIFRLRCAYFLFIHFQSAVFFFFLFNSHGRVLSNTFFLDFFSLLRQVDYFFVLLCFIVWLFLSWYSI